jgi:hypothetical protein
MNLVEFTVLAFGTLFVMVGIRRRSMPTATENRT